MRVTFIIPPSGFLLDELVFPTLGVLKVAAILERDGVPVNVLDLSGVSDLPAAFHHHTSAHGPSDVYGLTATMPQMPAAAAIAKMIRAYEPQAKVILGGPHATLMQSSARQEQKRSAYGRASTAMEQLKDLFDVVVCGDGEHAIAIALRDDSPNLVDGDDPKSPLFLTSNDLGAYPLASRHLIDMSRYHYQIDGRDSHSLIGQLGCPFACNFCGGRRSPFLRKIRTRSSEAVIAELRHLYETYGTTGFMFYDDELNVNRQFLDLLAQIVRLQDELGVDFRLRGLIKSELLTQEMAPAMYRAGFRQILVGFESGSPRILQNIDKKATRDDNTRCVEMLHEAGIKVKALMSIGHAGETAETVSATRDWLMAVQPDDFDVTIITVYPGTPYFDDATEDHPGVWTYRDKKNGDRLHAFPVDHLRDVNFYKGVPGAYKSFVYTDALSPDDLCQLRDGLEADVRGRLAIPYPSGPSAIQYEHSMGLR
jgi:anaerobic magnesium-protoporphyrin IX monomethyl ester cyclase